MHIYVHTCIYIYICIYIWINHGMERKQTVALLSVATAPLTNSYSFSSE